MGLTNTAEDLQLLGPLVRLQQLASPTLPVGSFAYSQGLETAREFGWVHDRATAQSWILELLHDVVPAIDLPLLSRMYTAWAEHDEAAVEEWSTLLLANRESAEFVAEEHHLGAALARLLTHLGISDAQPWIDHPQRTRAATFSLAAVRWEIPLSWTAAAWAFGWCENQVNAAVRLIPLGQSDGQCILREATRFIPEVVERGLDTDDDEIGFATPRLALASALHETQNVRLFRS
ncbi:urease accessory protein UreF [Myxococcota bacterium]|nr:urease accessory protein UreF [Myxococcota bacterium]